MLTKLYGYLAAGGALIVAILAALGLAKRSGVKQEQQKETEKALTQAKEASEIDSKVNQSSDSAIADELLKYTRKE